MNYKKSIYKILGFLGFRILGFIDLRIEKLLVRHELGLRFKGFKILGSHLLDDTKASNW